MADETRDWLGGMGFTVADEALWLEALTHPSVVSARSYQRLEFLGDRVLGLAMAEWLFGQSDAAEGQLSQRFHALVSQQACASIARQIDIGAHVGLNKQARDSGAQDSDNVLGDVMESLLGASLIESGFEQTRLLIYRLWKPLMESGAGRSKHPKSALIEWAHGNQRRQPEYVVTDRSGPDHSSRYTVLVRIHGVGEAEATASSKQEAETAAARLFMERFG